MPSTEDLKESGFSAFAYTMNQLLKEQHWSAGPDEYPFTDATLTNIIKAKDYYWDEDPEELAKLLATRASMTEAVHEIIDNELQGGDILPKDYPVWNLCSGLLYNKNWEYLDRVDQRRWCEGYGASFERDPRDSPLDEKGLQKLYETNLAIAISRQNGLLREILEVDGFDAHEVRSVPIARLLIVNDYDPDVRGADVRDEDHRPGRLQKRQTFPDWFPTFSIPVPIAGSPGLTLPTPTALPAIV